MTNQFTEEEMITIEYERHCSAYLFQDAYTLRVEKHGTLLQRKENLDVKEITKRIIPGEIKKYGRSIRDGEGIRQKNPRKGHGTDTTDLTPISNDAPPHNLYGSTMPRARLGTDRKESSSVFERKESDVLWL